MDHFWNGVIIKLIENIWNKQKRPKLKNWYFETKHIFRIERIHLKSSRLAERPKKTSMKTSVRGFVRVCACESCGRERNVLPSQIRMPNINRWEAAQTRRQSMAECGVSQTYHCGTSASNKTEDRSKWLKDDTKRLYRINIRLPARMNATLMMCALVQLS